MKKESRKSEEIIRQLIDHEKRIKKLESATQVFSIEPFKDEQKTLREFVKGKKFKNGQEQIAVIVGYYEKILKNLINKDKIKEEWINAKITNKFSSEFISRAKDVLIRVLPDERCDLTQSGEEFFESLLKNEPSKTTS